MQTQFTAAYHQALGTEGVDFANDTFKVALYTSDATLDDATTAYTTDEEVTGAGYTAGGVTLVAASGYPQMVDGRYSLHFEDAEWAASTITARAALIYNASNSNQAVLIIDFGREFSSSSETFALGFSQMTQPVLRI